MNSNVDFYFERTSKWQSHIRVLREIVLKAGLEEQLKWRCPCYIHNGRNIVLIHVFKEYCALLFFKGALLEDKKGILVRQTEHVQLQRQIRFTDLQTIRKQRRDIVAYIRQAIDVEQSGASIPKQAAPAYPVPVVLQQYFKQEPDLQKAFKALTPGRQRAYLIFFGRAKQENTVIRRIEKYRAHILAGKGMLE